jgi:hypothetical protein
VLGKGVGTMVFVAAAIWTDSQNAASNELEARDLRFNLKTTQGVFASDCPEKRALRQPCFCRAICRLDSGTALGDLHLDNRVCALDTRRRGCCFLAGCFCDCRFAAKNKANRAMENLHADVFALRITHHALGVGNLNAATSAENSCARDSSSLDARTKRTPVAAVRAAPSESAVTACDT